MLYIYENIILLNVTKTFSVPAQTSLESLEVSNVRIGLLEVLGGPECFDADVVS